VEIIELKREFNIKFGDIILIRANIRLPQVSGSSKSAQRINNYYKALMRHWERYVNKSLAKYAKSQYTFMTKHGFLFHGFDFTMDFTVTLNENGIISLYIDRREGSGGANDVTVRESDTWEAGFPLKIKAIGTKKRKISQSIIDNIRLRQSDGENYFEPIKRLARKYYNPKQWYLTPDGITVFYQEVTIAPHSYGIVSFPVAL
jgi:hypothetical protein